MAADLRLAKSERLNEIAHTHFALSDQVQDAQAREVGESSEEAGGRNRGFVCHTEGYHNICLDIYDASA